MIPGIHIKDLEVFGPGMFQDILNIMETLDTEELTKDDVTRYRDQLRKYLREGNNISKAGRRKPCKGCKDKKK